MGISFGLKIINQLPVKHILLPCCPVHAGYGPAGKSTSISLLYPFGTHPFVVVASTGRLQVLGGVME